MNIQEISVHRRQLFEVIDRKIGDIYHVTRSHKNVEQIREYVLVLLVLCREYLEAHTSHFWLHRHYDKNRLPNPIPSFLRSMDMKILLSERTWEQGLMTKDLRVIRLHFAWIFRKILEIHSVLEWSNSHTEVQKRYIWIHGNEYLKPRGTGWKWRVSGNSSLWSTLERWSGTFKARYSYDCERCIFQIEPWELYLKEVIRLGEGVEIIRSHMNCPDNPDNPTEKFLKDEFPIEQTLRLAA